MHKQNGMSMKLRTILATSLVALCLAAEAGSLPPAGQGILEQNHVPPDHSIRYIPTFQSDPAHLRAYSANETEILNQLSLYNLADKGAPLTQELVCPLIKRNVVWYLRIAEVEGTTDFVVIFPLSHGTVSIIPLYEFGMGPRTPQEDHHNIAILNRLIRDENISPQTDRDWMNLALFYLYMFQRNPSFVLEKDLPRLFGNPPPKSVRKLLPTVTRYLDGDTGIRLYEIVPDNGFRELSLVFGKNRFLMNASVFAVTKKSILDDN